MESGLAGEDSADSFGGMTTGSATVSFCVFVETGRGLRLRVGRGEGVAEVDGPDFASRVDVEGATAGIDGAGCADGAVIGCGVGVRAGVGGCAVTCFGGGATTGCGGSGLRVSATTDSGSRSCGAARRTAVRVGNSGARCGARTPGERNSAIACSNSDAAIAR